MKSTACRCLVALYLLLPLAAAAGPIRLEMYGSTLHQGSDTYLMVQLMKAQADSVTLNGPFTVRAELPADVTYLSHTGSGWNCSMAVPGELACIWSGNLTPTQPSAGFLSVHLQVGASTPLGPVNMRGTAESAQVPLPPPPVECPVNVSDTGCVSVPSQVLASSITLSSWGWGSVAIDQPGPVASVSSPWEADSTQAMVLEVRNEGYHINNTPVQILLNLPAGIVFDTFINGIPSWGCSAVPDGGGQLLTCTTPAMVNPQNGFVSLRVAVAPDVTIPGPHLVYARLHNNIQQPTLAHCMSAPASTGCGRLSITTRLPRVPAFEIVSTAHDPGALHLGQQLGLTVNFRNAGEGNADATRLIVALPPGIAFSEAVGAIPALTCTTAGLVADGQRVTCQGAGLPAAVFGQVRLLMDIGYDIVTPALLTAVIGLDHAATPTPGLIEGCAGDPSPDWCAWHELPVNWRCADEHGADGVYCDGFQLPPSP